MDFIGKCIRKSTGSDAESSPDLAMCKYTGKAFIGLYPEDMISEFEEVLSVESDR